MWNYKKNGILFADDLQNSDLERILGRSDNERFVTIDINRLEYASKVTVKRDDGTVLEFNRISEG